MPWPAIGVAAAAAGAQPAVAQETRITILSDAFSAQPGMALDWGIRMLAGGMHLVTTAPGEGQRLGEAIRTRMPAPAASSACATDPGTTRDRFRAQGETAAAPVV